MYRLSVVLLSLVSIHSPITAQSAVVIGFAGGFVAHDSAHHGEVQLATRLSRDFYVRVFENRRGAQAHRDLLRWIDTDKDGKLSAEEKKQARIAIYGHSWGASEAIALARALAREQIPVTLTVQVDSVQKPGENDAWIPSNVARAANFYQADGWLRGRRQIRAVDSSRTSILGNFQFDYKRQSVSLAGYPWYARFLMKPHLEIESDPIVWQQVESLIRSALLPVPDTTKR